MFDIEQDNYFKRIEEVQKALGVVGEIYFELFDRETDSRRMSDHQTKINQLVHLRAFETQSLKFQDFS